MAANDHDVSEQDVRYELGNPSESDLDAGFVGYHLGKAEGHVESEADASADADDMERAIALDAAYRVHMATDEAFLERSTELDVTEAWDAQSAAESLKARRDEALEAVRGFWFVRP